MRRFKIGSKTNPPGEDAHQGTNEGYKTNTGIPIGVFPGTFPNPHHAWGTEDMENKPVTFVRYNMSRGVHDVQLSNGWQFTNYGRKTVCGTSGYLNSVQPQIPGQSRLIGAGTSSSFVPRGGSPGQWQNKVDQANNAASTVGGPGQLAGRLSFMGQSGG